MRPRRFIRQAHLYAGLALSVLLFVLALTGSALVYKEAYWRFAYPELRVPQPGRLPGEELERAVAVAQNLFGEQLRSVKLPEPGVPAYHLYLEGGEAFLTVNSHELIDRWGPRDRVMSFLFDLHAHLLAGERGEQVGGVVGLLGVLMILTGLYLWWPTRKQFRWGNAFPSGWVRRRMIAWHRDLGLLSTPIVLILLLTAGGIVFYGPTGALLQVVFGDPPPAAPLARPSGTVPFSLPDGDVLDRTLARLPDARAVFYYPPGDGTGVHGFRLKRPCEIHPNGRSYIYVDAAEDVIERTDACTLPASQRMMHAMYPLHAGKTGGALYKFLTFLGGIALAALSFSGVVAYAGKLTRKGPLGPRAPRHDEESRQPAMAGRGG